MAGFTDIGAGNFFAEDLDNIASGLRIFCTCPANSVNAANLNEQVRSHPILMSGTGVANMTMVQMLDLNWDIEMPSNPFLFMGIIEA